MFRACRADAATATLIDAIADVAMPFAIDFFFFFLLIRHAALLRHFAAADAMPLIFFADAFSSSAAD